MKGRDKRKLAKKKAIARKGPAWLTKDKQEQDAQVEKIADRFLAMMRANHSQSSS